MQSTRQTGVHSAPNIQSAPDNYEIENFAADPDMLIETAMWEIQPWDSGIVLDISASTDFYLPRVLSKASHVIGLEQHLPSLGIALQRINALLHAVAADLCVRPRCWLSSNVAVRRRQHRADCRDHAERRERLSLAYLAIPGWHMEDSPLWLPGML